MQKQMRMKKLRSVAFLMPGPHGLIVQALDTEQKAAINKQYARLLQKLCNLKQAWCVPEEHGEHTG